MRRVMRVALAGLCAGALAACGSTVPLGGVGESVVGQAPVGSDGLAVPGVGAGDAGSGVAPTGPDPAGSTGGTDPADPLGTVATAGLPAPGSRGGDASAPGAGSAAGGGGTATTAQRGPIRIGMVYTSNDEGASQAGVDNGNTFTPRRAYESLVTAYNARGGLAGREIEAVHVELRSSSTSLSADLEAACARFTQDSKVAAVFSSIGLFSESFTQCLAKAATPQLAGDYSLGDLDALRRVPTFFAPATLTTDDRFRLLLERLTASGRLEASDRLGVVVEGCPFNVRTYDRTVVPTAKRLGLNVAERFDAECFESIGDLGRLTSEMQGAVLRFQGRQVNKVLFVSGSIEGNFMLFFATGAESQGYRPGYALTSAAVPAVQEANAPKPQLANAAGMGWLPSLDTTRTTPPLPAAKQCLQDLSDGGGITATSPTDRYYAFSTCSSFALYDAALRGTAGASDARSITGAIARLGTGHPVSAVHGERTDFSNGRRTGPAQGRVFAWSTGCGCFDYTGPSFPLTN